MTNTIANGRDDNGNPLEAGFYVVYYEEDCEPLGFSRTIQCGEIAEYDGETFWGETFWGELGELIDPDYAHRLI